MGFEYEQRRDAFFSLGPVGLWTLARLTTNSHIKEIDATDSLVTNVGTDYYVTYGRLIGDNQFEFDANLRGHSGAAEDELINIDAIDPEFFTLDMFGADDLLNQGSNYVTYSGYDPYGNKVNDRPTIEDSSTRPTLLATTPVPSVRTSRLTSRDTSWTNSRSTTSSSTWACVSTASTPTNLF